MKRLYLQFLLFLPVFCLAQIPRIEISNGKGGYKNSDQVILQKLQIETKIVGKISTNTITMVLKNNSGRLREGRVTFPLPEGISASGYALDINGKLRNAVPVEKEKAKEVYETIKKRNVDPGVLEKVEGNNFRTTVYPIAPNGGERTLQITYHDELKKSGNVYQYFLPLNYTQQIPEFIIKTTVFQSTETPILEEKPDGEYNFVQKGNVWTAETHKTNYRTGNNLKINFPQRKGSQNILMQAASGNSSYFLTNLNVLPNERVKKLPNQIAVVWDNSLSGKNRDHAKEFILLDEYFKANTNVTVKTYFISNTFDKGKTFKIKDGNWNELKSYLSKVSYDGGTDFGELKQLQEDEILFFTDGISSFGEMKMIWNKPTYTISSSNTANFNQLKYISNKTNGEFLNLNENDPKKEVRKLLFQPLKFLGIENNSSVSEVYPSMSETISQDFVLTGILNGNQTSLKAKFGYGNEVTETRVITLNAREQAVKDWEISAFWAQKKLNELEIFSKQNKDEIKNLSQQFGLVSSNMSLMVLENVEDYVRYDITPPLELKTQFDAIVKNNRTAKEARLKDLMEQAEMMTENLKAWWKKEYTPKPKRYPTPTSVSRSDTARENDLEEVVVTGVSEMRTSAVSERRREQAQMSLKEMTYIASNAPQALQGRVAGIQVGHRTEYSNSAVVINPGRITTIQVESKAEYMKLFSRANDPATIYGIYLQNRKEYENLPQYYFDVAQLLFKNNDRKLGLKVLSAIADLDLENEELYKLLAYKLKQAEVYDKELFAAQKVLEWRPFDPQSYRDVALAFEDNGNYQAALDNLYKVLTQSYTKELADRDNGIEEIIIMEINQLIANHGKQLNLNNINPKIMADLPVNIRVVINWNKDDTDIDLWVTDPNNERCYYSNKETEIGGRLSDDFTRGFGPEQFLLKKALKGKYKIQTNFFGERQVGIAGPTAIMAEIYINYATGKQERKIVVFQNQKENGRNEDGILIGEFEF
ncbi:VIT domain-containing protein [Chryseobacterium taichungense]|uniref:VIT domain-containing protein n=1 Tax=Chryseobacterium taichungense TaxID=295069 RepID=UPI0028A798D9|nr:VIT domain-containing protein [Chryseobacterium taichungense]